MSIVFRSCSFLILATLAVADVTTTPPYQCIFLLSTAVLSIGMAYAGRRYAPNDAIHVSVHYLGWLASLTTIAIITTRETVSRILTATKTTDGYLTIWTTGLFFVIFCVAALIFLFADFAFFFLLTSPDDDLGYYGNFHNILVSFCNAIRGSWRKLRAFARRNVRPAMGLIFRGLSDIVEDEEDGHWHWQASNVRGNRGDGNNSQPSITPPSYDQATTYEDSFYNRPEKCSV